ncbi:MAG: hypothetical protein KAS66_12720 [Candidatus Omnitrophica bacterium]|nr:hypothetical protein [Candidatus Omnitrophota bacterium]
MKVEIAGAIQVKDTWWPVNFSVEIDDKKTPAEKMAILRKTIERIGESGHVVSLMKEFRASVPVANPQEKPPPRSGNGPAAAFTWPPPTCELHREALAISKQQNKPGKVVYYCTKRLGDAYCNKRCTVDEKTGKPSFWEVAT